MRALVNNLPKRVCGGVKASDVQQSFKLIPYTSKEKKNLSSQCKECYFHSEDDLQGVKEKLKQYNRKLVAVSKN